MKIWMSASTEQLPSGKFAAQIRIGEFDTEQEALGYGVVVGGKCADALHQSLTASKEAKKS